MHKHSINLDDKVNTIVLNFWVKAEPELINFTSHNVETLMIEKINQAKKQLNFNNKQLSEALGYSRQYITKMLNLPQSEKIQDKVCKEIDAYLDNKKRMDEKECARLSSHFKKLSGVSIDNTEEITALKKKLENNQFVINKLDDQLIRAEKVHNEDTRALKESHSIIHNLNSEIKENCMHIQTLQ